MAWTKEQIDAIELSGSNIIVSAGAGSGKTAVLSERVLYKLTHGVSIRELLILTFSRAAAEEMKNRIRGKIEKNPDLRNELDALDSAYITTFDSFALSVVKKYHYLLGIKKDISISDDTLVALEKNKIIDQIFKKHYQENDEEFQTILKMYTIKNDTPVRTILSNLIEKMDSYMDKEAYLYFIQNDFFTEEKLNAILLDFKKLIEERKEALRKELYNASFYFDNGYQEKVIAVLQPIFAISTIDELSNYSSLNLPRLPKGSTDEVKTAKEALKKALDELLFLGQYGTEIEIKQSILETKAPTLTLCKMLEEYYEELAHYKKENDIYTFSDIASLAIHLLSTYEDVRLNLKNTFKEIMIDEYQDTNDIQEKFISYIANHNVYMVGDIKQSIYRFRGSNPYLFQKKYNAYSKSIDGRKIDLIKNFRSRSEVLENINLIFSLLMDEELGGAAYTVSHKMIYGNTSYDNEKDATCNYNCEIFTYLPDKEKEYSNIEIEIFAIAKDIKEKMESHVQVFDKSTSKMRAFRYSDAVIILDRSKYFATYKRIFEYLGIPLSILKDEKLNASLEIKLIKNIFDFIIHIYEQNFDTVFKYAFVSIARSFLYEYSDQYIFDIVESGKYNTTTLYQDFSKLINFHSLSIVTLLDFIMEKTDFYNKLYKIGDYKNIIIRIEKLYDMAISLSRLQYTIYDFKDYLEEVLENGYEINYKASMPMIDSVKILTIHNSKGLEYAFCYFADLDHEFNTKELKEKIISDKEYGIITPFGMEGEEEQDTVLKLLYKNRFMKEEISEKIRLFYVALTRAREKFYLFLPEIETCKLEKNEEGTIDLIRRLKFRSLGDFVYALKGYLPFYFKILDIEKIGLSKNYLYNKESMTLLTKSSTEPFVVEEIKNSSKILERKHFSKEIPSLLTKEEIKNMQLGTKVHEILEFVDFKNYKKEDIPNVFIAEKITSLLNNNLFQSIQDAKIYHEYEFVYEEDGTIFHGSIDLMLEYTTHIDIVDYKLKNMQDEHYKKQLIGYKNYIEKIANKKVNLYLYSVLDGKINEVNEV